MHTWTRWRFVGVLLFTLGARLASAEEITLTTYYPSPRGVYNELRTTHNATFTMNSEDIVPTRHGEVG